MRLPLNFPGLRTLAHRLSTTYNAPYDHVVGRLRDPSNEETRTLLHMQGAEACRAVNVYPRDGVTSFLDAFGRSGVQWYFGYEKISDNPMESGIILPEIDQAQTPNDAAALFILTAYGMSRSGQPLTYAPIKLTPFQPHTTASCRRERCDRTMDVAAASISAFEETLYGSWITPAGPHQLHRTINTMAPPRYGHADVLARELMYIGLMDTLDQHLTATGRYILT